MPAMSDGKERPGLIDMNEDVPPVDPAHVNTLRREAYDIGAHASLAQQAAFAQACAPKGDESDRIEQAVSEWEITDRRGQQDLTLPEYVWRAAAEYTRQQILLACAEERVLAAGQPMSGEVRRELEMIVRSLEQTKHCDSEAVVANLRSILAMGTRTDGEAQP